VPGSGTVRCDAEGALGRATPSETLTGTRPVCASRRGRGEGGAEAGFWCWAHQSAGGRALLPAPADKRYPKGAVSSRARESARPRGGHLRAAAPVRAAPRREWRPCVSRELAASADAGSAGCRAPARTTCVDGFGDFRQRVRTSGGTAPRYRAVTGLGANGLDRQPRSRER